jgi:hypothetical protein
MGKSAAFAAFCAARCITGDALSAPDARRVADLPLEPGELMPPQIASSTLDQLDGAPQKGRAIPT